MALSAVPFQTSDMIGPHHDAGAATYPDWALLNKTARLSELRNETTAECRTPEGQPVAVSFWLADPPAVSQFTVHSPGLHAFRTPPYVVCAEGAFVLLCVTLVGRSIHHFVYSAAGKNPSLHLLPDPVPKVASFRGEEFGLLPCGGEHCAVAFLDWDWQRDSHGGETRQYYACVFSSETNTWRRSKAAPLPLWESEQALFDDYAPGSYKQITVGESAVGWVDLMCGILLACNLFDETPVMRFIPFPAAMACITYDDGDPYYAPEYFRDVVCSGDLIRLVELDFDDPGNRTNGKGWRANTWSMKLDWDDWRRRCTVDVDDVSVDQSYSALLPELHDEVTGRLNLRKLDFFTPTLSVHNDNLLYMLAKVDQTDATAWVVVIDMKRAVADAIVPVSTKPSDAITLYSSCALPRYYPVDDAVDDAVEIDDGSEDGDSAQGYGYWGRNWCEESLVSWDFSDKEEEEDPVKEEEEEEEGPDKKEDGEEVQAEKTLCHKTNVGADMGNPVGTDYKCHEIPQGGSDPDDNALDSEHQHNKERKKRKTTRSSRRKKKEAQAQVQDRETKLLYLLRFVGCILMAIIIRASVTAFPLL